MKRQGNRTVGLKWTPERVVALCIVFLLPLAGYARHTVEERIAAIEAKKPRLREEARSAGGKLRILVFKNEKTIEVCGKGWETPRIYAMTGFSGVLGPKLREGDRQIPEGVYGISHLNPNSRFYLSLKVSYPNSNDLLRAKHDGRTNLGGDIMIHGKSATIGCIPIGDDAIEDVFYLANAVGVGNVEVVIAPYDMRKGRRPELEESALSWYPVLCREVCNSLCPEPGNAQAKVQACLYPIVKAARSQIGTTTSYDPSYRRLAYPNGDVPRNTGVCTDVVVRALRDGRKIDLQRLVHEDMKSHFAEYPARWGLKKPDANIDHRRVENLRCFFKRRKWSLPVTGKPQDYTAGDLVTCTVGGNLPHIMIVSDRKNARGVPLVIHNIGSGTKEDDCLFAYPLTGHYRLPE